MRDAELSITILNNDLDAAQVVDDIVPYLRIGVTSGDLPGVEWSWSVLNSEA